MAIMKITDPGEVAFTLTMAFKLKDWKLIHHNILTSTSMAQEWPLKDFLSQVREAIDTIDKGVFTENGENPEQTTGGLPERGGP